MTSKSTPKTNPPKAAKRAPSKKALLRQLIKFYWQILEDPELKPSDRIASAKRLEALAAEDGEKETTPQVRVVLNFPSEA